MIMIRYDTPDFRIKREDGKEFIFDALRKRWLQLTPEEWVRQNFIQHLVRTQHYPAAMIAIEKEIAVGELRKRFDIVVYDARHQPWMMVECKAQSVALGDAVLQQVLRYHLAIPATYLLITNGNECFGWEKQGHNLELMHELPAWKPADSNAV